MKKIDKTTRIIALLLFAISVFLLNGCGKNKPEEVADHNIEEHIVVEEHLQDDLKQEKEETTKEEIEIEDSYLLVENDYSYYVNFLNVDGSVLQRSIFKKGEIPSYNGLTPTYSDGSYIYNFIGWDKPISEVKNTQTYQAVYDKTKISNHHNHVCNEYVIQNDGSWVCKTCHKLLEGTDKQYFTVLKNNQPTNIVSLVQANVSNTNGISKTGNDISYANQSNAQDIIIRTNSANTNITINDESTGSIRHYGSVGKLDILHCHTGSYYENGSVAFVEIKTGRIVLTNTSKIKVINIAKKDSNSYDNPIIATSSNVTEQNMPEVIMRDQVTISEDRVALVTIQSLDSKGNVIENETEQIYSYGSGTTGSTQKTVNQNSDVSSNLGKLVLDEGTDNDKSISETDKEERITEEIEESINTEKENTPACIANGNSYETIKDAFEDLKSKDVKNINLVVAKDLNVVFDELAYILIDDDMTVTLDLNGHVINSLCETDSTSSFILNNGNLTIMDSTADSKTGIGMGIITQRATHPDDRSIPGYATNIITNKNKLTINSGKFELEKIDQGNACYTLDIQSYNNNCETTINGGNFYRDINKSEPAIRMYACSETYKNKFVVNGGKIEGYTGIWLQMNDNGFAGKAELIINDGEIIGHDATTLNVAVPSSGNSLRNTTNMSIRIKGGQFTTVGSGYCAIFQYNSSYENLDYLKLSGGTFHYSNGFGVCGEGVSGPSSIPSYNWIADGYHADWDTTNKVMRVLPN